MIGWILRKMSWKSFGIGMSAALLGGYVARPALVSLVKSGIAAQTFAANTWQQVRTETAKLRAEADSQPIKLIAEMRQLRDDLASIKTKFGAGTPAQH
jgi:hypothetical protein